MSHSYFRCCCWHIVFTALYSDSQQIVLRSSSETLTAKTQEEEILVSVLLSQNCFPPHGTWQPNSHTDSPDPSILVGRPVRMSPNRPEWQALRIRLYLFDCSQSMENTDLHCQSLALPVEIVSALVTLSDRGKFSCFVCGCFSKSGIHFKGEMSYVKFKVSILGSVLVKLWN